MSKSFSNLRAKLSPERRTKNQVEARARIAEVALQELRRSLNLTQEELARILKIKQASLSKLESQEDMYISTLSRFVAALGGRLKLIASFPGREVVIDQFK